MHKPSTPMVMPWLDLLRFVAAFLVMFAHARTLVFLRYGELDPDSQNIFVALGFAVTRLGNEAVVLFFVLSGYLVGGRLWRRCREGSFDARLYVIDRTSRIVLPLLAVLVVTLLLRYQLEEEWFWQDFFGNLLFLQGIVLPELGTNQPLWSLPYEVWCYLMALGAGLLWTKRYSLGGGLVVAALLLFMVYLVPWYTFVWLMGAVVYQWRDRLLSRGVLWLGLLLATYGWMNLQFADGLLPGSWLASSVFVLGYFPSVLVLGAGLSLVVQQIAQMPPKAQWAIKLNHTGSWLAASSYSLYLSHFMVLVVLDWEYLDGVAHVTPSGLFTLLWVVVLCQLVAFVIYMLSEMHTDRARRWLRKLFPASDDRSGVTSRLAIPAIEGQND